MPINGFIGINITYSHIFTAQRSYKSHDHLNESSANQKTAYKVIMHNREVTVLDY